MKRIYGLLIIMLASFSMPVIADRDQQSQEKQQDATLMLNRLLHIKNEKYRQKTDDGKSFYNSLLAFKEWENLYIKYSKFESEDKKLTKSEMKNLLFMGYIVRLNRNAAISESFSSDLLVIYNANKDSMLSTLSEVNFLIPSSCHYLNNYFGFEGENGDKKEPFVKDNKAMFIKYLGEKQSKTCLDLFK